MAAAARAAEEEEKEAAVPEEHWVAQQEAAQRVVAMVASPAVQRLVALTGVVVMQAEEWVVLTAVPKVARPVVSMEAVAAAVAAAAVVEEVKWVVHLGEDLLVAVQKVVMEGAVEMVVGLEMAGMAVG